MALQLFIQNPDSGEPWALCGSVEQWDDTVKAIGHYVQAERENAIVEGQAGFSLDFKMIEMTEQEVADLPDM